MEAMLRLKKLPDETKLAKIAEVLDEDKDGIIGLSEALKVSALTAAAASWRVLSRYVSGSRSSAAGRGELPGVRTIVYSCVISCTAAYHRLVKV